MRECAHPTFVGLEGVEGLDKQLEGVTELRGMRALENVQAYIEV